MQSIDIKKCYVACLWVGKNSLIYNGDKKNNSSCVTGVQTHNNVWDGADVETANYGLICWRMYAHNLIYLKKNTTVLVIYNFVLLITQIAILRVVITKIVENWESVFVDERYVHIHICFKMYICM